MRRAHRFALFALCACCGGGGHATKDAPNGDAPNDITMVQFQGEFVDWDSTDATFCGVFGAKFQVENTSASASTAPNGRFILEIPEQEQVLVDITPPADPSQCVTGSYSVPAIAVLNQSLVTSGQVWSGRAFVTGREAVDLGKAQVFVHVDGTPSAVTVGATFSDSEAMSPTSWAAGNSGQNVFFRDVDATGGTTTVNVAGVPAGSIPLVAGKMTEVSVIAN